MPLIPLTERHLVPQSRLKGYRQFVAEKIGKFGFRFDSKTQFLGYNSHFSPVLHEQIQHEIKQRQLSESVFALKLYTLIEGLNELATNFLVGWMISGNLHDSHPVYSLMFRASNDFAAELIMCVPGSSMDEKRNRFFKSIIELSLVPADEQVRENNLSIALEQYLNKCGLTVDRDSTLRMLYHAAQHYLLSNWETVETFVIDNKRFTNVSVSGTYKPEDGSIYNRYDLAYSRRPWFNLRAAFAGLLIVYGPYAAIVLSESLVTTSLVCVLTAVFIIIRDADFLEKFHQRYALTTIHELIHEAQTSESNSTQIGKMGLLTFVFE